MENALQSLDQFLDNTKRRESHRDYDSAKHRLDDFKGVFGLKGAAAWTEQQDKLAVQYIQQVLLSIQWYSYNLKKARRLKTFYTWVYFFLLLVIPIGLALTDRGIVGGTNAGTAYSTIAQLTIGLSVIAGLTQLGNMTINIHARFSIWCKTRSALKTIWYSTVSRWNGAAILADEKTLADFEKDLNSAIEQAQQLLSAEQQDYYDKLSTEFPDLLETVAKAAASVKALITSYVPSAASVGDNAAAGLKARDDLVKALDTRTQVSAILAELEKGRPEPDAADFADWKAKKVVWEAMKTTAEKEIIAAHASRIALTS